MRSYFEDQYNLGENITEFQVGHEHQECEKEGRAFIVQESNGPGSRCRKGSLNFRNKLNHKAIKDKNVAQNEHMRLYNLHKVGKDKKNSQDNIDITSDDSDQKNNKNLSKVINRLT